MDMEGTHGENQGSVRDKSVHYSDEQITVLEQLFIESENPSESKRLAMIRENTVLSNLNSQQIQAWFETRRRLEGRAFMLQLVNEKMAAANKVLMLENEYLQGEVQLIMKKIECIRKLQKYVSLDHVSATELPRSVFKRVTMASRRKLMPLVYELIQYDVQQMQLENDYFMKLLQSI